jgi:CheY-like chemotaxis protein
MSPPGATEQPRHVVALTDDLLFATRIHETGRQLGVEVARQSPQAGVAAGVSSHPPDLIVVALGLGPADAALAAVRELKADPRTAGIPIVGVYPHVEVALRRLALEAGCDRALARSAFTTLLPEILRGRR